MKSHVRTLVLALLIFNSLTALYGGGMLIIDPTGEQLQLPEYLLDYSPFQTYLIPGIVLFIFNGLFSALVTVLTIIRYRLYPQCIVYQGTILAVWLTVQINMLQLVNVLHYIMGSIAMALIACGWVLSGSLFSKR